MATGALVSAQPRRPGERLGRAMILALCFEALAALTFGGCTNENDARRALESSGYKNIRVTGWDAWSCSRDDGTCTGFEATAPNGAPVRGAVGCGYFFKGCTVRLK